MPATIHYETSFKFLGSAVASKKMLVYCVLCIDDYKESPMHWIWACKSWRLKYLSQNYFLNDSGIHFGKSYLTEITVLVMLVCYRCIHRGVVVQISELSERFGQKVSTSLSSNFLSELFVKGRQLFKRIRAFPRSESREKCMTIIFRRICETNLYEWCIICATHLRSTYFWAASLDGSSRCCHNPSILISTNLRRIQREVHFLPSSAQLHKGEFYSSIDLRKWKKKLKPKRILGLS